MVIDWVSLGMTLLGVLATMAYNRLGQAQSNSAPATPTTGKPAVPVNNGHPLLDAVKLVLNSVAAQNPQLAQLEGIVTTLIHPTGNIKLSLTKEGTNATAQPTVAPAPPSA